MTTQREGIYERFRKTEPDEQVYFCPREFWLQMQEALQHRAGSGEFPIGRVRAFLKAIEEAMRLDAKREDLWELFSREVAGVCSQVETDLRKKKQELKERKKKGKEAKR